MSVFLQDQLDQQGINSAVGNGAGSAGWNWGDWGNFLFGNTNNQTGIKTNGALGAGLGILQGLGNAYTAGEQLKLGRAQLDFSREAFYQNLARQTGILKGQISDRANARYAANPGATGATSAADYTTSQLAKYGVA